VTCSPFNFLFNNDDEYENVVFKPMDEYNSDYLIPSSFFLAMPTLATASSVPCVRTETVDARLWWLDCIREALARVHGQDDDNRTHVQRGEYS